MYTCVRPAPRGPVGAYAGRLAHDGVGKCYKDWGGRPAALPETLMTIRIRHNAPRSLQFTATAEGHALPLDMPQPQGAGPDPHDYFDTALGGCKAMTVMLYAQRKEIPLESVDVDVVRDAGEERKGIYRLTAKLTLHGPLSDAHIDELFAVAEKCPVHKLMTAVDVQVSTLVVRPA